MYVAFPPVGLSIQGKSSCHPFPTGAYGYVSKLKGAPFAKLAGSVYTRVIRRPRPRPETAKSVCRIVSKPVLGETDSPRFWKYWPYGDIPYPFHGSLGDEYGDEPLGSGMDEK